MIGVGENGLTAEFAHLLMRDGLNASASCGADEGWRFDVAVRCMDDAGAHEAGLFFDVEF